jgi:tetratricopeptide (TPR) repeat protein
MGDARMRILLAGMALVACCLSGCLKTEVMTSEEMNKYPRPNKDQYQKVDPSQVRQPKPETCLEAGKMYEALARSEASNPNTPNVAQQREMTWKAKQAYQQALRLKPNWAEALAGLARVQELEGNPQAATEHFQKAVQAAQSKEDAVACHEAGLFYGRIKQFDLSIAAMLKANQLDPTNRTYAMNYGFALARAGRYEEGYTYFSKIMSPSDAATRMAQMSQHTGDLDRAKQYASFAVEQNPKNAQARELLTKLDQNAVQQAQGVEATPHP